MGGAGGLSPCAGSPVGFSYGYANSTPAGLGVSTRCSMWKTYTLVSVLRFHLRLCEFNPCGVGSSCTLFYVEVLQVGLCPQVSPTVMQIQRLRGWEFLHVVLCEGPSRCSMSVVCSCGNANSTPAGLGDELYQGSHLLRVGLRLTIYNHLFWQIPWPKSSHALHPLARRA